MRGIATSLICLAAVLLAGCGLDGIPSSSLTFRDAATDALISASEAQGTLTLSVGETHQVKVVHTYTTDNNNTQSNDVTQFVHFIWDSGDVATIDQLGNITALKSGVAVLRAKYSPDFLGDSDNCRLTILVN